MTAMKRALNSNLAGRVKGGILAILMAMGLWVGGTLIMDGFVYSPERWLRVDELTVLDTAEGAEFITARVDRTAFIDVDAAIIMNVYQVGNGDVPTARAKDPNALFPKGSLYYETKIPVSHPLEPGTYYAVFLFTFKTDSLWIRRSLTYTTERFVVSGGLGSLE